MNWMNLNLETSPCDLMVKGMAFRVTEAYICILLFHVLVWDIWEIMKTLFALHEERMPVPSPKLYSMKAGD